MTLYFLDYAVNTKETGEIFPQVQKVLPALDYNDSNSVYRIFEQAFSFNNATPHIDYAELKKGSKPSDFLSSSMFNMNGFLISEKGKQTFDSLDLPPHKFYNIPVKLSSEEVLQYYWLHMLFIYNNATFKDIQNENILFGKSSFWVGKHLKKTEQIQVASKEELEEKERNLDLSKYIVAETLVMKRAILSQTPDIFKIPVLNQTQWIIKEDVKNILVKNSLTGFVLKEITNLTFD